jgi:hypothetical protein
MHGAGKGMRGVVCTAFVSVIVACSAPARVLADEGEKAAESNASGATTTTESTADETGPNSGTEPGYFSLDRLDAYLEFESQFDQSRVRSRYGRRERLERSQTNRDWTLEERVGFDLAGSIVDPSFINFGGDLSFALTQSHSVERSHYIDQTDDDSGYLSLYDLRANFFQGKALSGSVYALRHDDRINRRFQPSLDERRTGYGTSWTFADDVFPMTLSYDYLETDRTGNRDRYDDEHYTESNLRYSAGWHINEHNRFEFTFEHAETKQEYQGLARPFETTRDLFTLEHEYEFGPDYKHDLRTLVHWQEESGDFARDFFQIGPQLTLRHTDDLQTMYKYQFDAEKYEGLDVETHRTDWQLVHQLFSNLTTTVDVFGLYEDVEDDIKTTQYGASVDWQYNRKNSLGRFFSNLALAYDTEEGRGDSGTRLVLNESATFRDPVNVTLRNRNVLRNSIVVTDSSNRRIYVPGIDYAILRLRDFTQLVRIRTGNIADGDTILVDYQYDTPHDGQIDTARVDFNLEQRFDNGFIPYYRLSYRDQDVNSSAGFGRYADRTDHHRMGLRYEKDRWQVGAEYEIFDDTVEPYDAFHLDGLWRIFQSAAHSFDASSRFSRFFFEGGLDRRNVNVVNFELDHRWRLRDDLSTFERVAFRWEDDSIDGLTHAWDVTAGLDYTLGDLSAQLTFEYDRLDLPHSEEDDFGVFFRIRRDIPNVLAKW